MVQLLSFALSAAVIYLSLAVIAATVKAELPHILRALGIEPAPLPPSRSTRAARVRAARPSRLEARPPLRAAA